MPTLAASNKYLRNPELRRKWTLDNVRQSSIFEGARGLSPSGKPTARARLKPSSRRRAKDK